MGTSVINPMIFYWMDVLQGLEIVLFSTTFIGIVWFCFYCVEGELDSKNISKAILSMVVSMLLIVFIPSKETILTMLVADMITYENIELTKDSAMALVDYIVEQIKTITG